MLTPDILWITLAQGFAHHGNHHGEALRDRFVDHQGKRKLEVLVYQMPAQPQAWSEAIQEWALLIRDQVGADLYHLLECNFSTTTPITRTVSQVVMMDAFQKYFDYMMRGICGIPQITLEGTVEDWQSIHDRVQTLSQYELTWWTDRVLPLCREFIKTAAGSPSLEFWQAIYKPQATYGATLITGWVADLFPYLQHPVTRTFSRNPILAIDRATLTVDDGIPVNFFSGGLSQAPLKLENMRSEEKSLGLVAGFIGVTQTEEGSLKPELGWAVQKQSDTFTALLDKIQQQHITHPPLQRDEEEYFRHELPKEHIQMLARFDGATLYAQSGHAWKIAKYDFDGLSNNIISWPNPFGYTCVVPFMELEDGRCIVYFMNSGLVWLLLGRPSQVPDDVLDDLLDDDPGTINHFEQEKVVVIAEGIAQLFERIFAAEGRYYFDDPEFVATKNIAELG